MINLTPPHDDVEDEYFCIVDLGVCWKLVEFASIFFSGLFNHGGSAAIPKASLNEKSKTYTRATGINYPSGAQLNGSVAMALGALPRDTANQVFSISSEMRNTA